VGDEHKLEQRVAVRATLAADGAHDAIEGEMGVGQRAEALAVQIGEEGGDARAVCVVDAQGGAS
jgi:hypothetical protein